MQIQPHPSQFPSLREGWWRVNLDCGSGVLHGLPQIRDIWPTFGGEQIQRSYIGEGVLVVFLVNHCNCVVYGENRVA
jgi:hypothetical protein